MVLLARDMLPDVILLMLQPKGNLDVSGEHSLRSLHGSAEWKLSYRVVKLWTVPAEDLLAANEMGLIPWVPLARDDGSLEALLQCCLDRIEELGNAEEIGYLFAVTHVMAEMRYDDPRILKVLGGKKMLTESPFIRELLEDRQREATQELTIQTLEARFHSVPEVIAAQVRTIQDQSRLGALHCFDATCAGIDDFRKELVG
jgi:hypothetical protein